MARADDYAQWIVDNQDKKGTEDFNTVVQAYQEAKAQEQQSSASGLQPGAQSGENIAGQVGIVAAEPAVKIGAAATRGLWNTPITSFTGAVTHPLATAVNVAKGIESLAPMVEETVTHGPVSHTAQRAMTLGEGVLASGRNIGAALASPESAFAMPYNMAAYEQAKIRANPNAPEYKNNPYAMQIRGQSPTQEIAARQNMAQRANLAGMTTPNNPAPGTPEFSAMQAAQPPSSSNFMQRMSELAKQYSPIFNNQ